MLRRTGLSVARMGLSALEPLICHLMVLTSADSCQSAAARTAGWQHKAVAPHSPCWSLQGPTSVTLPVIFYNDGTASPKGKQNNTCQSFKGFIMSMIAKTPSQPGRRRAVAVPTPTLPVLPNIGDMPIVRTTGNLDLWRKVHRDSAARHGGKSGSELLADIRAERETRCA